MSSVHIETYDVMSTKDSPTCAPSFSTSIWLLVLKTFKYSSRILKWKARVRNFRRPCHLLPGK
jgi:hypothetical protein